MILDFSIQKFPLSLIHIQHLSQVWQPVPPAQDLAREHLQGVVEELDHLLHPLCSHLPLLQVAQLIGSSVSKVSPRCLKGVSNVSSEAPVKTYLDLDKQVDDLPGRGDAAHL